MNHQNNIEDLQTLNSFDTQLNLESQKTDSRKQTQKDQIIGSTLDTNDKVHSPSKFVKKEIVPKLASIKKESSFLKVSILTQDLTNEGSSTKRIGINPFQFAKVKQHIFYYYDEFDKKSIQPIEFEIDLNPEDTIENIVRLVIPKINDKITTVPLINYQLKLDDPSLYKVNLAKKSGKPKDDYPNFDMNQTINGFINSSNHIPKFTIYHGPTAVVQMKHKKTDTSDSTDTSDNKLKQNKSEEDIQFNQNQLVTVKNNSSCVLSNYQSVIDKSSLISHVHANRKTSSSSMGQKDQEIKNTKSCLFFASCLS